MVLTKNSVAHDTVPYFMERFRDAYTMQLQNFAQNVLQERPAADHDRRRPGGAADRRRRDARARDAAAGGGRRHPMMAGLAARGSAWLAVQAPAATDSLSRFLYVESASEVVVTVRAACVGCSWGEAGREAAALRVLVDGKYSQHILLFRGESAVRVSHLARHPLPGRYRLTGRARSGAERARRGRVSIDIPKIEYSSKGRSTDYTAQSMAPILYARPNTVGRFTDVPLLMWYEIVPTPRGSQFRYSVIFSNEDGGTATDRLMATWGRTTDIEFVYGVEVDERDTHPRGRISGAGPRGAAVQRPARRGRIRCCGCRPTTTWSASRARRPSATRRRPRDIDLTTSRAKW